LPVPILDIELADWVRDFQGTLARELDFLGLPPDPACERFHESRRRVRPSGARACQCARPGALSCV
jgi:hypothetical protein